MYSHTNKVVEKHDRRRKQPSAQIMIQGRCQHTRIYIVTYRQDADADSKEH